MSANRPSEVGVRLPVWVMSGLSVSNRKKLRARVATQRAFRGSVDIGRRVILLCFSVPLPCPTEMVRETPMSYVDQTGHAEEKDLALYLKDQLSLESLAALDAHLEGCQSCADKLVEQDKCLWYLPELSSAEVAPGGERRRHPRVVTNDPASLQILNPFSATIWDVRIIDVSLEGLRTHTSKSLAPGSLIKVRMHYSVACGDVRYCIPADTGYYAGIRLHDYFDRSRT